MIPAGLIWWCRISAINSFSVWMMWAKRWLNKCHLAKPLCHTKDSDSATSTTYSTKLSQLEMVKSFFSMVQKIICFSSQLQRKEASTPHKTISHPGKLKVWSWKGPSKLAGRERHFRNLHHFFGSHNKFPLHQWWRSSKKLLWFLLIGGSIIFETKSDGGGLQHFNVARRKMKEAQGPLRFRRISSQKLGTAQETIH